MRFTCIKIVTFFLLSTNVCAQLKIKKRAFINASTQLDYIIYDNSKERAVRDVILFLHGGGQSGEEPQLPSILNESFTHPYFFILPHLDNKRAFWNKTVVMELLYSILDEFDLNQVNIHLAGFSRGASAAWELAMEYPDQWSSLTVVSGRAPLPIYAHWISDKLPINIFHSEIDDKMPFEEVERFVQSLKKRNHFIDFKTENKIGHELGEFAFNQEFFDAIEQLEFTGMNEDDFIDLREVSHRFEYDMRYAVSNNFLKQKVYPCARCVLRVKTAKSLIKAASALQSLGYKILLFDCYRPQSVQYEMWKILPDAKYVANPDKGSMHNRGGAVDISLITEDGQVLDMGTDFDHFGEQAHRNYEHLTSAQAKNRKILDEAMFEAGFEGISTEWWHFNLPDARTYPLANFQFDCDQSE